ERERGPSFPVFRRFFDENSALLGPTEPFPTLTLTRMPPAPLPSPRPPSLTRRGETSNAPTQERPPRRAHPFFPSGRGLGGREKRAGVLRAYPSLRPSTTARAT